MTSQTLSFSGSCAQGEQCEEDAEGEHAQRSQPGQLAEAVQGRDAKHVDGDRTGLDQMVVVPGVGGVFAGVLQLVRLEREFQHADVAAVGDQDRAELIDNLPRRLFERVDPFAGRGIVDGDRRGRIGVQRPSPDQVAGLQPEVLAGLPIDAEIDRGQGDDLGRQRQIDLTLPMRVLRGLHLDVGVEIGDVDRLRHGGADAQLGRERDLGVVLLDDGARQGVGLAGRHALIGFTRRGGRCRQVAVSQYSRLLLTADLRTLCTAGMSKARPMTGKRRTRATATSFSGPDFFLPICLVSIFRPFPEMGSRD